MQQGNLTSFFCQIVLKHPFFLLLRHRDALKREPCERITMPHDLSQLRTGYEKAGSLGKRGWHFGSFPISKNINTTIVTSFPFHLVYFYHVSLLTNIFCIFQNAMLDSLELFEEISQNEFLENTEFILFLNKHDLFVEKLKTSKLSSCFPDYEGKRKSVFSCFSSS